MDEIGMVDKNKYIWDTMMMDLVPDARTSAKVLTHRLELR